MLDSAPIVVFDAGVAKQAYAQDLKSCGPKGPYRFDPGLRHHNQLSTVRHGAWGERLLCPNMEVIDENRSFTGRYSTGLNVPL